MRDMLRRFRGLTGLGLTWGTAWAAIGAGIGLVMQTMGAGGPGTVPTWALGMGAYGFVSGVGFGKLLWFLDGRRTLHDLALRRVTMWGALGGAVVPVLFGLGGFFEAGTSAGDILGAMAVTAGLGGACAAGSLVLARRAADAGDRERSVASATPADERHRLGTPPFPPSPARASTERERVRSR